jgi:hypothetical protein
MASRPTSLHKIAPLPRGDGSLEPPNQIFRKTQQELLCGHAKLAKLLTAINIDILFEEQVDARILAASLVNTYVHSLVSG